LILLLVLDRGPRFRRTAAAADVKMKGKSLSGPSRVRVGCTGRGLRPTLANSKENELGWTFLWAEIDKKEKWAVETVFSDLNKVFEFKNSNTF
jgi:hypothetical protein